VRYAARHGDDLVAERYRRQPASRPPSPDHGAPAGDPGLSVDQPASHRSAWVIKQSGHAVTCAARAGSADEFNQNQATAIFARVESFFAVKGAM
jgi:hypothetical protein